MPPIPWTIFKEARNINFISSASSSNALSAKHWRRVYPVNRPAKFSRRTPMLPRKTVNGITFNIRHTMLLVSNLDRTLDFYTRLLGMDVQRRRDTPERNERV